MFESIVSVHVPKVAGTSFLHQLKALYGEERLLCDYKDDPVDPRSIINIDPYRYAVEPIETIAPFTIVHGHFHPRKYEKLKNVFRVTFLRHPIENIVSIYNFWRMHDRNFWDSPIFQYLKDSDISLQRFAMLPKIRYLYSDSYFGEFDMDLFDFIGDYEKYDQELKRLGECLGVKFNLEVRLNVTKDHIQSSTTFDRLRLVIGQKEYSILSEILKDDIEFYLTHCGR